MQLTLGHRSKNSQWQDVLCTFLPWLLSMVFDHWTVNQYTSCLPLHQVAELWTASSQAFTALSRWTVNQYPPLPQFTELWMSTHPRFYCLSSLNCEWVASQVSITSVHRTINEYSPGFHCLRSLNCERVPSQAPLHQLTELWISILPGFQCLSPLNPEWVSHWTLNEYPPPPPPPRLHYISSQNCESVYFLASTPVPQFTELWRVPPHPPPSKASTASDHWTVNQYTSWLL